MKDNVTSTVDAALPRELRPKPDTEQDHWNDCGVYNNNVCNCGVSEESTANKLAVKLRGYAKKYQDPLAFDLAMSADKLETLQATIAEQVAEIERLKRKIGCDDEAMGIIHRAANAINTHKDKP